MLAFPPFALTNGSWKQVHGATSVAIRCLAGDLEHLKRPVLDRTNPGGSEPAHGQGILTARALFLSAGN